MTSFQNSFNLQSPSILETTQSLESSNAQGQLTNLAKHWKSTHPYKRSNAKSETIVRFTLPELKTKVAKGSKSSIHQKKSKDKLKTSKSIGSTAQLTPQTSSRSLVGINSSKKQSSGKTCCNGNVLKEVFGSTINTVAEESEYPENEESGTSKRKRKSKNSKSKKGKQKSTATIYKSKSSKSRSRKPLDDGKENQNSELSRPLTSYTKSLPNTSIKNSSKKLVKSKSAMKNLEEANANTGVKNEVSSISNGKARSIKGYVKLSRKSSAGKNGEDYKAAQRRVSRRNYYGSLINERFKEWKREQDQKLYLKITRERNFYEETAQNQFFQETDLHIETENENLPTEQFIAANQYLQVGENQINGTNQSPRNLVNKTEYKKLKVIGENKEPLRTASVMSRSRKAIRTPRSMSVVEKSTTKSTTPAPKKTKSSTIHTQIKEPLQYSSRKAGEKIGTKTPLSKVVVEPPNPIPKNTAKQTKSNIVVKPILDRTGSKTLSFRGGLSKEILSMQGASANNESSKTLVSTIKSVVAKNLEKKLKK